MNIALSSDEKCKVVDFTARYLEDKGYALRRYGAVSKKQVDWVDSSIELAEAVASGKCSQGVLFCWTGTGSSIAANKVPGIRAALCVDPEEAKGAKRWNHANVLVMSARLTSEHKARKILDAWFSGPKGSSAYDKRNMKKLSGIEKKHMR